MIKRRNLLGLLVGAAVAPAIIRTVGLIMPIKPALLTTIDEAIDVGFQEGDFMGLREGPRGMEGAFVRNGKRVWERLVGDQWDREMIHRGAGAENLHKVAAAIDDRDTDDWPPGTEYRGMQGARAEHFMVRHKFGPWYLT